MNNVTPSRQASARAAAATLGASALRTEEPRNVCSRGRGRSNPSSGGGGSIGVERAGLRFVTVGLYRIVLFFGLFTLLDGLWPLWDPRRQALHDKIAGSVVVRVTQT